MKIILYFISFLLLVSFGPGIIIIGLLYYLLAGVVKDVFVGSETKNNEAHIKMRPKATTQKNVSSKEILGYHYNSSKRAAYGKQITIDDSSYYDDYSDEIPEEELSFRSTGAPYL